MTTLRTNAYEVSPNATALTTSNTTYDNIATGGTLVSDNSVSYEGTFCAKATMSAGQTLAMRSDVTATGQGRQRIAIKASALPATNNTSILQTQSTGSNRGAARILTDGTFQLRNGSSSVWDSVANGNGNKLTSGHWYCLEHVIDNTNSRQRLYVWDENQTLLEDSNWQTYNSGTFNQFLAGSASGNAWTVQYDGHIITDDATVTGLIGPRVVQTDWVRTVTPDLLGLSDTTTVDFVSIIANIDFESATKTDGQSYVVNDLPGVSNLTGTWTVDTTLTPYQGSKSARLNLVGSNATILIPFSSAHTPCYIGVGININTLPSADTNILNPKDANGIVLAGVRIMSTGQLRLRDGASNNVYTSPSPVFPYLGASRGWYWIEHYFDQALSRQKAVVFDYAGNLLHDTDWQTWSAGVLITQLTAGIISNCNFSGNFDRLVVGISQPTGPLVSANNKAANITDSEGLTDLLLFDRSVILQEVASLADNNIVVAQTIGSVAWASNPIDNENLTDPTSVASGHVLSVDDLLQLTEPDIAQYNVTEIITEPEGLTDNLIINRVVDSQIVDSEGLTDANMVVGKVYGPTVTDSEGLTDSTVADHGIPQFASVTDTLGLTENFVFAITRAAIDTLGLSDSVATSQFTLTPTITDSETLGDNIAVSKNGQIVGTFSKQDLVANWLRGLGYTGTIQDMQYKYLLDRYTSQFGAPTKRLSAADMEKALGLPVKWLLDIVTGNAWVVTQNDVINLTDNMPALQGVFQPNVVLSNQDQTAGTTATTASFTPNKVPTGRLYYLVVTAIATTAATAADPTAVQADVNAAAFTKLVGVNTANNNCNLSIWAIDSSTISGAGTITITFAASQNTIQWKLVEFIGTKISATLSFGRKQAIVTAQNATTTPSVTLGAAPGGGNLVICAEVYNASNANSNVAGAGATLTDAVLQATSDALQLALEFDTLPTNLQTLGFTTANASGKALAIVELEAA